MMRLNFLKMSVLGMCVMAVSHSIAFADPLEAQRDAYAHAMTQAMLNENVDSLVAHYADDGRIMPEYQETGVGAEGVSAYFTAYFDRFDISSYSRRTPEVIDMGDMVIEIGSFAIRQTHTIAKSEHEWTGTYYDVWEKQDDGDFKLYSTSWNYDANYEGVRQLAHFDNIGGISAIQFPGLTIQDELGYELTALRKFGERIMIHQQPELLHFIYAEDSEYAPHDRPVVKGRAETIAFFKEYTSHWPPFDYVDVVVHRRDVKDDMVLEHMSYNVRGVGANASGVGMGKGLRIWKRSKAGQMQSYRQIAMHDY